MKKSILNLEGVEVLSKKEQKSVNGGLRCLAPVCDADEYVCGCKCFSINIDCRIEP